MDKCFNYEKNGGGEDGDESGRKSRARSEIGPWLFRWRRPPPVEVQVPFNNLRRIHFVASFGTLHWDHPWDVQSPGSSLLVSVKLPSSSLFAFCSDKSTAFLTSSFASTGARNCLLFSLEAHRIHRVWLSFGQTSASSPTGACVRAPACYLEGSLSTP